MKYWNTLPITTIQSCTLYDTCLFLLDDMLSEPWSLVYIWLGEKEFSWSGHWADGEDWDSMPRPITAVNWCCKVHLCLAKSIMFSMGTAGQVCNRNMSFKRTIVPPAGTKKSRITPHSHLIPNSFHKHNHLHRSSLHKVTTHTVPTALLPTTLDKHYQLLYFFTFSLIWAILGPMNVIIECAVMIWERLHCHFDHISKV